MEFFRFFWANNPADAGLGLIAVVMLAYAIGDVVSNRTKAIFSMIFVTGAIFLFAFWGGLPKDIFNASGLMPFAAISMPFILVHMGTLMKVRNLINEWKTVTVAFAGLVGLSAGLFYAAGPIIGNVMALTAAGPISGGVVATLIVREAAEAKGFAELAVFASLLLVLQNFVGLPIASFCLKQESARLLKAFRSNSTAQAEAVAKIDPEVPAFRLFPETPRALRTPFVLLFKGALVAYLAVWFSPVLSNFTGGYVNIHKLVLALVFGIIFYETGFLEHDIFTKANAAGYVTFFCLVPIWTGLTAATPGMVMELFKPVLLCFVIALAALAVTSLATGPILGYSWFISMAISVTCLFGFPGTFILSNEVSAAVTDNEEERKHVLSQILPKMLVSGFTTVTIGSVVLAGYLARIIAQQ
ncbi:MAG: hypothetical protein LBQ42_04455 [Synergistaceae bacterium]|jgi:hypothetical protein|nr:hypothetical protein [Synergistaceae bacterium]